MCKLLNGPSDPLGRGQAFLDDISKAYADATQSATADALLDILEICGKCRGLEELVGEAVVGALRAADVSWADIADALDLSRQGAWERYRHAESAVNPATLPPALLEAARTPGQRPSALQVGEVYTRVKLRRLFDITDATLKNGVFPMKTRNEIWLFVTRDKTPDRTQFTDELIGDELRWEGQTAGRADKLIDEHKANGFDILVFYRESRRQYKGAGFRFEGRFERVTSDLSVTPSQFVFRRMC